MTTCRRRLRPRRRIRARRRYRPPRAQRRRPRRPRPRTRPAATPVRPTPPLHPPAPAPPQAPPPLPPPPLPVAPPSAPLDLSWLYGAYVTAIIFFVALAFFGPQLCRDCRTAKDEDNARGVERDIERELAELDAELDLRSRGDADRDGRYFGLRDEAAEQPDDGGRDDDERAPRRTDGGYTLTYRPGDGYDSARASRGGGLQYHRLGPTAERPASDRSWVRSPRSGDASERSWTSRVEWLSPTSSAADGYVDGLEAHDHEPGSPLERARQLIAQQNDVIEDAVSAVLDRLERLESPTRPPPISVPGTPQERDDGARRMRPRALML